MNQPSTRPLALASLLLGATAIGFAPLFVRLSEVGPSATAFYRLLLAQPLLWIWVALEQRRDEPPLRPSNARDLWMLALAGLFFAGDMSLWHWSLHFTTVANSTLLTNFAPILVTIGARVLFGERITLRFMCGLAIALSGAIMLVGASLQLGSENLLGNSIAEEMFAAELQARTDEHDRAG